MIQFKSYAERKAWLSFIKAKFDVDGADNLIVEMRNRNVNLITLDARWESLQLDAMEKALDAMEKAKEAIDNIVSPTNTNAIG